MVGTSFGARETQFRNGVISSDFSEFLIHAFSKYRKAVFRRTDEVIEQNADVVLFPNEFAHSNSIFRSRSCRQLDL